MARSTLVVDNYTYEDTDAHRTLQALGDLWNHHVHGGAPPEAALQRAASDIARLFVPLAGEDDPSLAPHARVTELGKRAAERIDQADPVALQHALREMWSSLAALARESQQAAKRIGDEASSRGVVAGLFLSDGGVPKKAVDSVEVGYRGVIGDRQATRVHHGRPWQALCLWSTEVVAGHAAQGHPIQPGSAGENVSIRGVDWSAWRPGKRIRLGEVEATIAAYAIPCFKNARWFTDGDYERMSHEQADGSRLYARVDRPGRVTVGDAAVVLAP